MGKQEQPKPSIVKVLIFYGADESDMPSGSTGWRPIHCPFHEDRTKSASVNTSLESFACMGCGVKGDSWKIVQEREGLKWSEAKRFIERELGIADSDIRKPAKRRKPYKPSWS